jgi:hypothetical protein
MPLSKKIIKKILKKNKEAFDMLEHYDKTREKLWARQRIYLTLNARILKKLKEIREKTGKPISRIVEEAVLGLPVK